MARVRFIALKLDIGHDQDNGLFGQWALDIHQLPVPVSMAQCRPLRSSGAHASADM
jgi:hypothetical protein